MYYLNIRARILKKTRPFLFLLLSSLSLCSSFAKAESLTVWAWDPNFNVAAMNEAAYRYKQSHPNFDLAVVDSGKSDIEQKLHIMLASGIKDLLPDIVLIDDYNAQKYLQAYPGSFEPLQDRIDYDQFTPYKVEIMTLNKNVYGIPFDSGVAGMFYRTDYLAQAGFSDADLQNITWEQFIEIGKKVKEKTGKHMLALDISDVTLPHIMMQSGGDWYFDKDGQLNIIGNESLKAALRILKKINETKIARPISGWSGFVGSFNAGQVATVTSGVWIIGSIKSVSEQSGKWKVAPIPKLSIASGRQASNQGGSSWYVLSTSRHKSSAIDFLATTFAHDTSMYQKLLLDRGAMATFLPASHGLAYYAADPFFSGQRIYTDFFKWLNDIPEVYYGMYTQEVDDAISAEIPAVLKGDPIDDVLLRIEENLKYQLM